MKTTLAYALVLVFSGITSAAVEPVCIQICPTDAGLGDNITLTAYDSNNQFVDLTEWSWVETEGVVAQPADPDGTITFAVSADILSTSEWLFFVWSDAEERGVELFIAGGSSPHSSSADAIAAGGTCQGVSCGTSPLPNPIIINPNVMTVYEEGETEGDFDVSLVNQPPSGDTITVTVDPNNGNPSDDIMLIGGSGPMGSIDLTFDSGNWNVPQTVVFKAIDDDIAEPSDQPQLSEEQTIRLVSSYPGHPTDANFVGENTVTAIVIENDFPDSETLFFVNTANVQHTIDEKIYGQFLEHIFHSTNGGLWGDLVWNRSFEYDDVWDSLGGGTITLDTDALNDEYSIKIVDATGTTSLIQYNFKFTQQQYSGSLWMKGSRPDGLKVQLMDGTTVLGEATLPAPDASWTEYPFQITSSGSTQQGSLRISPLGPGTVYIDQVSMMGQDAIDTGGYRPDLLQAVADLNPPVIRYPGGCYASAYLWKDGIGPQHTRHKYPIYLWEDFDTNSYGTDEFLRMCESLGAEPVIVVNTGLLNETCGMPVTEKQPAAQYLQDALDWIEYCNGSTSTYWGAKRAENGHPVPYNVKYWEIDNEVGHIPAGGGISPYIAKLQEFVPAMRAYDPNIKIIVCGSDGYGYDWNEELIDNCANLIDYISVHYYEYPVNYKTGPGTYESFIEALGSHISFSSNPNIKVYMSEWSLLETTDFSSGLYAGGLLNTFMRTGDILEMGGPALFLRHVSAPEWDNVFINFDHTGWYPSSNYVVMKLWRDHYAPKLVETTGGSVDLNVASTVSEDGTTLNIHIVNPDSTDRTVEFEIDSSFVPETANMHYVAPGSLNAVNSLAEPNNVHQETMVIGINGQKLNFIMPGYSVGVITVNSEPAAAGETLYNGIVLPQTWPPQYGSVPYAPMPVPYLDNPPAVVTIDVGRQLFVDDFLIESTTMTQNYHQATMYSGNPVLAPTTVLEFHNYSGGMAGPFSGGSWYDPSDSLFKLWYRGAEDPVGTYVLEPMLYATSTDGKNWDRPDTNVLTMAPLHHFTCTPSNPSVDDDVTIAAFDEYNQQVDMSSYNVIEMGWEGTPSYSIDNVSGITFDGNGGAVFTCVAAMFNVQGCEFSYYNEGGTPEAEVFQMPFPFDTLDRGWNITDPLPQGDEGGLNSTSILLDQNAPASERFKWFSTDFLTTGGAYMRYRTSPDGIDWTAPHSSKIIWGDRSTVFYNPFRDVWVCSQRTEDVPSNGKRNRGYTEGTSAADLMSKIQYNEANVATPPSVHWVGADPLDPRHTDPLWDHIEPELYTLDAMPYESLMLGQFSIWTGPLNADCEIYWVPKRCDILLGFSRDGFHWDRPDRTRFISSTWDDQSWRKGNVQSCVGTPLVVGDEMYFYFNARPQPSPIAPGWDYEFHTGLAILRRDGFASMDASVSAKTLTTRPVKFANGKYLFVNTDCPSGSLKVEVLTEAGEVISPFTLASCDAISADTTCTKVTWGSSSDLSSLQDTAVRFRFTLDDGSLYAFWVSPDASGASYGYVGGGGPGFTGPRDTVGVLPECGGANLDNISEINMADLAIFAAHWLSDCTAPDWCAGADMDPVVEDRGSVNLVDFANFSLYWLETNCN